MALTLSQRNQLRKRAAQEAAAVAPAALMEGATGYEVMLAKLQQDQFRLKQVQSTEGKARLKAELLPDYIPYIDGVLEGGQGAQDDVLVTVMLWRFDAGDFEGGLIAAEYVLAHGLQMPDRFNRTTGCVVAEEVAEAALNALKAGGTFDFGTLTRADVLTASHDMPDQARAKLMLAIGRVAAAMVDDETPNDADWACLETARHFLSRAIELHDKCGAKKDLERVERLIKKHAGTTG
ncbi:Phage small terminase subunit [compost metagenome]